MRKELQKIGSKGKHIFRAKVALFGSRMIGSVKQVTILLQNITQNGETVAEHVWVVKDKNFRGVQKGDVIEFSAKVMKYNKGYKGDASKVKYASPLRTDYTITNPTQIKIISKGR